MSRTKPVLATVIALAVLALIVRQVTQAAKRTFTPLVQSVVTFVSSPPKSLAQLDRATPRFQNGMTLQNIERVNLDNGYTYTDQGLMLNEGSKPETDSGLWILLSHPLTKMPLGCGSNTWIGSTTCDPFLTVTGRSSTGTVFPLRWKVLNDHLMVIISAGSPKTYRWIDVRVDDKQGHTAKWRITHLPGKQPSKQSENLR